MSKTNTTIDIAKTSVSDLELFMALVRSGSLRGVARRHKTEPAQISRLVKKFEARLGVKLFARSASGLRLTPAGQVAQQTIANVLAEWGELNHLHDPGSAPTQLRNIRFASVNYLATRVLSSVVSELQQSNLGYLYQLIDMPPDQFVAAGLRGAFEVALHTDELDWPKSWQTTPIGSIRYGLFAAKNHPRIKSKAHVADIKNEDFVYPLYFSADALTEGVDHCPLQLKKRRRGVGTSTAEAAMELTARTEQLSFLPELITREKQELDILQLVNVYEWPLVKKTVYLSVHTDSVSEKLYVLLRKALAQRLK
jgi:DNA-binding transcriptional LysR family regulator